MKYRLFVNADRTLLVRLWSNGHAEFSIREGSTGLWGPPVSLTEERV
jgi:hypothetical protein